MPINVEIKARARNPVRQEALASALATAPRQVLHQIDTFFCVPSGRLKLREFAPDSGQLIYYERQDTAGPKTSRYWLIPTTEPGAMCALLAAALGLRGEVRKQRTVYLAGQTRIHVDRVEALGTFIELEVVLQADQPESQGEQIARQMIAELEIQAADLIDRAYLDLLNEP